MEQPPTIPPASPIPVSPVPTIPSPVQVPQAQPPQAQPLATPQANNASSSSTITYTGFGQRFLALLIDIVILTVVNIIIGTAITLSFVLTGLLKEQGAPIIQTLVSLLTMILTMLINTGYLVFFTAKKGQTLGKKAMKIKVVHEETQQFPGFAHAFLRETIGRFLSGVLLFLGYFWMIWDKKKQSWHDKLGKTIVIKV